MSTCLASGWFHSKRMHAESDLDFQGVREGHLARGMSLSICFYYPSRSGAPPPRQSCSFVLVIHGKLHQIKTARGCSIRVRGYISSLPCLAAFRVAGQADPQRSQLPVFVLEPLARTESEWIYWQGCDGRMVPLVWERRQLSHNLYGWHYHISRIH